jgi:protein farnesyltransferase subunit beta
MSEFKLFSQVLKDDDISTETARDQKKVEQQITNQLHESTEVLKEKHLQYIQGRINKIRTTVSDEIFEPWSPFYMFLPIIVTKNTDKIDMDDYRKKCVEFLKNHQNIHCGWSGYLVDYPTIVPLYGCTILLGLIGLEEGYELVDQQAFYKYLMSFKNPDGSFSTFPGGETDLRSTFAVIFVAWMYNILTPELTKRTVEFVRSCQNYDGGFGPLPFCESHGGYTYAAIGILTILGKLETVNIHKCARWIADRQMPFSGGFNGRTHKLIDTCYTWWVGSPAKMISEHLKIGAYWNDKAMSEFILRVAQFKNGGFRDRPPHFPDPFHTMWGCAGLCVCGSREFEETKDLPEINSVSGIPLELFDKMKKYFEAKEFHPSE